MGLVARSVEAAGIPTLCLSSALDITRAVNPPRAVFLDFPLGHTAGKPADPELQRAILADALSSFHAMTAPGSIRQLPYRWSEDEGWKEKAFAEGDDRLPRCDAPQYQTAEDQRKAESGSLASSCPHCG
ncbi:MAG: hypothetical protein ACM3L8_02170 [Verrucomicrobiota bacterium]